MNENSELHVVFGTGPVGMAVMEALCADGKRVRMVNRSGRAALPDGVELLSGDAGDADFARRASAGASVVYFALNPPYDRWPELFPRLQAGVIEGAAAAGATLVAMENLYACGHTGGRPMSEDTPSAPDTRKGRVRAQMHADLMAAHAAGKVRAVAARASDFFGPRALDSAMGSRVFEAALAGKAAQIIGNPDMPHTYTYVLDVGRALVTLGAHDEALGQVWHIPSAETLTTRAFIERIYAETGHPAKISPAPKLVLTLLGLVNPIMREVNEMAYEFEEPFVVDHSRYAAAFGDHATPLDEAIAATVRWFRENPRH